jgi:glycosyltransferase involved in cell wall biosynthesis
MTLSVILPNYNHARYLPEALDAILAQSYPAKEIIIVDDASTDSSVELLKKYQQRHPQIKLYQNEKNAGPIITINRAVGYATSEYLAFCAADDRILPGFFKRSVGFLLKYPQASFCTSNSRYFKEDGSYFDATYKELGDRERLVYPEELVHILRTAQFSMPTHSSMYRRDQFIKYGGLNTDLKMLSDFYLSFRIAFHAPIGYIPESLASFRQIEGSYSAKMYRDKKLREQVFRILFEKISQEPEEVRSRFTRSSVLYLFGLKMLIFLIKTPPLWEFLIPILKNKLKDMVLNKIKNYAKRR